MLTNTELENGGNYKRAMLLAMNLFQLFEKYSLN